MHVFTEPLTAAQVDEPDVVGPLAVFPLLAQDPPALRYRAFAQAVTQGASARELDEEASVNDLLVVNPLDVPVLLYEGEEVLGAQQNRTFDASVLVPARSELEVAVSCVEAERWDDSRHGEAFAPAPQTAYPELRRAKSEHMRRRLEAGGEARAQQSEVWSLVAAKARRHGVDSPTSALHDVFERRRETLAELSGGIAARPGQVGMLVAIAGRFVVLDQVSDAEAFAALHGPLVQGYALDALEATAGEPPSLDAARRFVASLAAQPTELGLVPRAGLGALVTIGSATASGTALVHDGACVTVTAFAHAGTGLL